MPRDDEDWENPEWRKYENDCRVLILTLNETVFAATVHESTSLQSVLDRLSAGENSPFNKPHVPLPQQRPLIKQGREYDTTLSIGDILKDVHLESPDPWSTPLCIIMKEREFEVEVRLLYNTGAVGGATWLMATGSTTVGSLKVEAIKKWGIGPWSKVHIRLDEANLPELSRLRENGVTAYRSMFCLVA